MLVLTGQFMQGLSKPNHAKLRRLTLPSSFIRWTCDYLPAPARQVPKVPVIPTGPRTTIAPQRVPQSPHAATTLRPSHLEAVASTHKEAKEPTLPPGQAPHHHPTRTCRSRSLHLCSQFKPNLAHKYAMQDLYMCSQIKPMPTWPINMSCKTHICVPRSTTHAHLAHACPLWGPM